MYGSAMPLSAVADALLLVSSDLHACRWTWWYQFPKPAESPRCTAQPAWAYLSKRVSRKTGKNGKRQYVALCFEHKEQVAHLIVATFRPASACMHTKAAVTARRKLRLQNRDTFLVEDSFIQYLKTPTGNGSECKAILSLMFLFLMIAKTVLVNLGDFRSLPHTDYVGAHLSYCP